MHLGDNEHYGLAKFGAAVYGRSSSTPQSKPRKTCGHSHAEYARALSLSFSPISVSFSHSLSLLIPLSAHLSDLLFLPFLPHFRGPVFNSGLRRRAVVCTFSVESKRPLR